MNDHRDILDLLIVPNMTETRLHKLLARFKEPNAVKRATRSELTEVVGSDMAYRIQQSLAGSAVDRYLKIMDRLSIAIVPYYAVGYPAWLKAMDHFPPVLFIFGQIEPADENALAIVGTRGATVYGKGVAANFAAEFVRAGITVVSGMARGIDTAAHTSALKNGGRTIAVLGCGLDITYPPENRRLMAEIATRGAVISEFVVGTPPLAQNFPKRNRIIAGLSRAIVAIEAKEQSGVMNTVNWAVSQGKDVFAIPGNIYSKTSAGTNRLIKEGATPVTSATEVLESLGLPANRLPRPVREVSLDDQEHVIWEALSAEPVYLDELAERTGRATAGLLKTLLGLEIKGLIRQLPGMMFVKNP